jgi:nickel/cobalt transporter (NicO) family protein
MIRRLTRGGAPALAAILFTLAGAAAASAHPLGNFTVNRALVIEIGSEIGVTAVLDLAEIPAYEVIRDLDTDGDDRLTGNEGEGWASDTCAAWRGRIQIALDGAARELRQVSPPSLSSPSGAGGLPTLRLECAVAADGTADGQPHDIALRDTTTDDRGGWREVTARAQPGADLQASNVPTDSPSAVLTAYPEDELGSPPDEREAALVVVFGAGADGAGSDAFGAESVLGRSGELDPLSSLIGGALSPGVIVLAVLLSLGLGAGHAISPGHGKTLVAAYVLGSGGSARSALQIGLWVAISHTAGVLVLGAVTLLASEFLLPERLIAWLSLVSGVVVTVLGLVLLAKVLASRRGGAASPVRHDHGPDEHGHHHEDAHGGHDHADEHPHGHDEHGHQHYVPAPGELSWRSAVALGFAGGAVPSASALIVLLVAIATDRPLLGIALIGCFGIGMAAVLGGLALVTSRLRQAATRDGFVSRAPVRRAVRLAPVVAGLVVLVTGVAFTAAAIGQLA